MATTESPLFLCTPIEVSLCRGVVKSNAGKSLFATRVSEMIKDLGCLRTVRRQIHLDQSVEPAKLMPSLGDGRRDRADIYVLHEITVIPYHAPGYAWA